MYPYHNVKCEDCISNHLLGLCLVEHTTIFTEIFTRIVFLPASPTTLVHSRREDAILVNHCSLFSWTVSKLGNQFLEFISETHCKGVIAL